MNEKDYAAILSENILKLRKEKELTQEGLAEKLNISFQAVSKWENNQSSPDIAALPLLAEIFGVSVDSLFGLEKVGPAASLPWEDDGVLRGVVFRGKTLLEKHDDLSRFTFVINGAAVNVESWCNVSCGDVAGDVSAGTDVKCGDVAGNVSAGTDVKCCDVTGDVNAGTDVNCGDISGNANAGVNLNCGDISGCANAGVSLSCGGCGNRG